MLTEQLEGLLFRLVSALDQHLRAPRFRAHLFRDNTTSLVHLEILPSQTTSRLPTGTIPHLTTRTNN